MNCVCGHPEKDKVRGGRWRVLNLAGQATPRPRVGARGVGAAELAG
jgi:hypothetical protein